MFALHSSFDISLHSQTKNIREEEKFKLNKTEAFSC